MIEALKSMSKTLLPLASGHPLQLDFVRVGTLKLKRMLTHVKRIPYTILAQTLEGSYEVRCQGGHEIIHSGGMCVIPADTPVEITHHPGSSGKMRARWTHLRFSHWGVLDFLSYYDIPLQIPTRAAHLIGREIGKILRLQKGENSISSLVNTHLAAMRVLSILCDTSRPNGEQSQVETMQTRFLAVLNFIHTHLSTSLTVANLAETANMSISSFHESFRDAFGLTPMRYVRELRFQSAARQLITTDEPVGIIANETGFPDAFHFSRAFSRRFGLCPTTYRKQFSDWNSDLFTM